jgi:hypothetical protein
MELDINPAWVSGVYFHPTGRPHPPAFRLFPDEQVGAQHYLQTSSRDFFSVDLRSATDATGPPPSTNPRHHPASSAPSRPAHRP